MRESRGFTQASTGGSRGSTQAGTGGSRGFTLIELLVVIAIIGMLAAVVLASLGTSRQKGRDARRISDISQIKLALELYYDANSTFPTDIYAAGVLAPSYISSVPTDPSSNANYPYSVLVGAAPSGSGLCGSYHLGASLETQQTALSSDIDATAGGTYGTGVQDGATCGGAADFNGLDTGSCANPQVVGTYCYDVRP